MTTSYRIITLFFIGLFTHSQSLLAQETVVPPSEDDYYKIITLPVPEDILIEAGGVCTLPNGSLAVSTRRGDVYIIDNPYMENGSRPRYRLFASGLHEILGLNYLDGDLVCAQRGELTRLKDNNGDGYADEYEAIYVWPLSGHYHEYSYGPKIDKEGNLIVTSNVAFGDREWWRGESRVPWRGWTMKITPEGEMKPFATGMRSPAGLGMVDDEFFYADNQGDWIGSGGIVHVEKGDFTGHPAGLKWTGLEGSPISLSEKELYAVADPRFSPPGEAIKPENIEDETPQPLYEVAEEIPQVKLPAVWLPHGILGISLAEMIEDNTDGAFGPFAGQVFIGDQGQAKLMRVDMEKVKGEYQGVVFPFREKFQSGILRICWGKDGSMFLGQTNRGWGSLGNKNQGLQRLVWTGKVPFEMKTIKAQPDGFEIEFTQPVDKATASNPDNYEVTSFIYKYHPVYGSPIVNDRSEWIRGVQVSKDGLKARIVLEESMREKYIYEIKAAGVRNYADSYPLLHDFAYYTLNNTPDGTKLNLPERPKPDRSSMHHNHGAMANMDKSAELVSPDAKAGGSATTTTVSKTKLVGKRINKRPAAWDKVDVPITLGTLPGLRYDRTDMTVKAGSRIKWTFVNRDDMIHNLVLVKPGTANSIGKAALALGLKGEKMNYVPNSDNVLYHTGLLQPGTSETIYLYAPDKPGTYQFVCTFPGHAELMRGVLRVVE
ncbi:MAG: plastocyanin/azurin family copper-binding protein [Bacteroidota bacterium]